MADDKGIILTKEDFDKLIVKLDKLPPGKPSPDFSDEEVKAIKLSVAFTNTFHHDPDTLRRMERAFVMAEGFVGISKTILAVIAFVVVLSTQWDRMWEIIRGTFR